MKETIQSASKKLAERYIDIINKNRLHMLNETFLSSDRKISLDNLLWMCEVIIQESNNYPIDKLSRWLGYIQGVLAVRGFINVDEERDFSRPLFHAAYSNSSTPIPPTRNS